MKSVLMEEIVGIKLEHIGYEMDRIDLYYAGILIETELGINDAKRLSESSIQRTGFLRLRKSIILSRFRCTKVLGMEVQ